MAVRQAWLIAAATAATLALLLQIGAAPSALASPMQNAAETGPASETSATQSRLPFTSIPPVSSLQLSSRSWQPARLQRILVLDDGLQPESMADDITPGALREADRLAHELADAKLVAEPPVIAYTSPEYAENHPDATQLTLKLDDKQLDSDTAMITVNDHGVTVSAANASGLFRGSRSLLQTLNANGAVQYGSYKLQQPSPTRSVHLDVARKRYTLSTLEQLLLRMSWTGLNELELHFSENEGWAIASDKYPEIASDDAYTKDEIRQLVAYAADLHIRITPSLDMPGHLDHVLETHPEWQLQAADGTPVFGALDITNPQAREFAFELIDEYTELFEPGEWNLGADEFVDFADHSEVAALSEYARSSIGSDANASDALTEFVNEAAARLERHGYSARVWSDGMLKGNVVSLNPDITVAYWTTRPADVASIDDFSGNGNPLLNVNDEYLYFVLGERVGYVYPTGEAILSDWNADVFAGGQLASGQAEVTGGMFAVWSDIPEALNDTELLARLRLPVAAMSWKLSGADDVPGWDAFQQLVDDIGDPVAVPLTADGSRAQGQWPPASNASPAAGKPGEQVDKAWLLPSLLAAGALLVATTAFAVLQRRRANP